MDPALHAEIDRRLAEYGLQLEPTLSHLEPGHPQDAILAHGRTRKKVTAILTDELTLSGVPASGIAVPDTLLIGPRIHERSAEAFRRLGIAFIDAAGNASIRMEGVFIDVRGRRSDAVDVVPQKRPTNLFSTRRAQVIFAMLQWPEIGDAPLRALADRAGVSQGQVPETLTQLDSAGYLASGRRIARPTELLDRWVAAYPHGLGAATLLRSFYGESRSVNSRGRLAYVSGESAVSETMRATTTTVYVAQLTPELILANRWRTDLAPNVFVRRCFWKPPAPETGMHTAPSLLVYADLLASGDSRQAEAAATLRQTDDRLRTI